MPARRCRYRQRLLLRRKRTHVRTDATLCTNCSSKKTGFRDQNTSYLTQTAKKERLKGKSRMAGKSRRGKSHWATDLLQSKWTFLWLNDTFVGSNRRRSNEVQSNMDLVHVKSTDLLRLWARQKDNYSIIRQSWVCRVTEAGAVLNYSLQVSTVVSYMHHWLLSLFFFFFSFSSNLLFSFTRHCSLRGISHQK